MNEEQELVRILVHHYPTTQAIYLFGTYGTEDMWPESDVDIALLLPPAEARLAPPLVLSQARLELEQALKRDVDLINLRQVSTVLQKEVIMADRRLFCADVRAADEFEMLTLASYQKLNEERADIIAEGLRSGRFYDI